MTDIVQRLRDPPFPVGFEVERIYEEAADEIERLRADCEKYKEWCRKLIEGGDFEKGAENKRLRAELLRYGLLILQHPH